MKMSMRMGDGAYEWGDAGYAMWHGKRKHDKPSTQYGLKDAKHYHGTLRVTTAGISGIKKGIVDISLHGLVVKATSIARPRLEDQACA